MDLDADTMPPAAGESWLTSPTFAFPKPPKVPRFDAFAGAALVPTVEPDPFASPPRRRR